MTSNYESIIREVLASTQKDIVLLARHQEGYSSPNVDTPLFRMLNSMEFMAKAILQLNDELAKLEKQVMDKALTDETVSKINLVKPEKQKTIFKLPKRLKTKIDELYARKTKDHIFERSENVLKVIQHEASRTDSDID